MKRRSPVTSTKPFISIVKLAPTLPVESSAQNKPLVTQNRIATTKQIPKIHSDSESNLCPAFVSAVVVGPPRLSFDNTTTVLDRGTVKACASFLTHCNNTECIKRDYKIKTHNDNGRGKETPPESPFQYQIMNDQTTTTSDKAKSRLKLSVTNPPSGCGRVGEFFTITAAAANGGGVRFALQVFIAGGADINELLLINQSK